MVDFVSVVDPVGVIDRIGPELKVCTGLASLVELQMAEFDLFVSAPDPVELAFWGFVDIQTSGTAELDAEEQTAEPEIAVVADKRKQVIVAVVAVDKWKVGQVNERDTECPPDMDFGSRVQNTAAAPKLNLGV